MISRAKPSPKFALLLHLCMVGGFFLLLGWALASTQDSERRTHSSILVDTANPQVLRGAELYYASCAVCHGDTATGLAEARLSFPEDHQRCERCHRRNNPAQMNLGATTWRNAFSIGEAPGLVGGDALSAFPNASVLFSYMSATMPRPFPGKLTSEDYLDITLFLLEANGVPVEAEFNEAALAEFKLP